MTGEAAPKFIYFDLGNVLLTFDHRVAARQLAALVDAEPEQVWDFLFASGLQDRYELGAVTSQQLHEQFCARFAGARRPSYESFHRANSDIFRLNVPVVPIVAQLASAGYRLGILSNTCEEHWKHVATGRYTILQVAFSQYVLSHEQRQAKPSAGIYQAAIARAGCEPGEIFFMDDRPENVAAARREGLDAIRFCSARQLAAELRLRQVRFNY